MTSSPLEATAQLVQGLTAFSDPNLLVGVEHFSDAGVYRLAPDLAIVQSVDFFPPLVDDPFTFGRIAAANSLSDVYAMGARPVTALNIVGFPDKELDLGVLREILRGGAERVAAAGAVILGGHSVRDAEIKYGLSVTGVIHPDSILTNAGARVGDQLVLTKALGTGFITTANRAGKCPPDVMAAAIESMTTLNRTASEAAIACAASAATDITGFGLAGHAREMADASGVTMELSLTSLPLLAGAGDLAGGSFNTRANAQTRAFLESMIDLTFVANDPLVEFLFDPQTSGGLLVSVAEERAAEFVRRLHDGGAVATAIVGCVRPRGDRSLLIRS